MNRFNADRSRKNIDNISFSQTSDIRMYHDKDSEEQNMLDINSQISVKLGNFGQKHNENLFEKSMSQEEFFNHQMKAAFNDNRPLTDDRVHQKYFSGGTFY